MSGLARIALSDGISVSGSDAKDSSVLTALTALGAKVSAMHEAANVEGADVVIYSTAISATNPEMAYAVERSIPILTRAQALALLMKGSRSIAVAGTHGKTTTSSMMTVALQACGVDPSFAIGGTLTASIKDGKVILTDEKGGIATVTATDLKAGNGVIHVIDAVVLPK